MIITLCEKLAQKTFIFTRKPYSLSVIFVRLQLKIVVFVLLESYICFRFVGLVESYAYY